MISPSISPWRPRISVVAGRVRGGGGGLREGGRTSHEKREGIG